MNAETPIVKACEVLATELGARLFRNNSGKLPDAAGRWVTFGIGNPPGGGSDLIGFDPVLITPNMVGSTIAQFLAVECKTLTGKKSELQRNFINTVIRNGGKAGFARNNEELKLLLRG